MIGEIALALLSGAVACDDNETKKQQSMYEYEMQKRRNEAEISIAKEQTKQQIIGGVFDLLNSCIRK